MVKSESSAKWQEFRKSKMGLVFGMVLTILLALVLMLYGGYLFCLTPILVALIIFMVPKYFGLKSKKKAVAFGLVVLLLVGLMLGFAFFTIIKDLRPAMVQSADGVLTEGQVSPFRPTSSTTGYNYSVLLKGGNDTPVLWVTTYDYMASNQQKTYNLTDYFNTSDGRVFYTVQSMPASIYRFDISYLKASTDQVTKTATGWGPIMVTDQQILVHELYYNTLYVVVNVGIWFAFILLGAWWMESSKKRMEDLQKRKEAEKKANEGAKEKFVCSECGADVPGNSKECPQCGEKFED